MKQQELATFNTLTGVQGFLDANADIFGSINASDARKDLDRIVVGVQQKLTMQLARQRATRGATEGRKRLEQDLRKGHLMPLAEFARARLTVALTSAEDYKALTPSAGSLRGARLVQVARAMAKAAEGYTAALTAGNFPPDVLAQLTALADAVQAKLDQRAAADREVAGATAGISEGLAEGRMVVRTIGAVVKRSAHKDPELLAEWRAAQRVKRKTGTAAGRSAVAAGAAAGKVAPVVGEVATTAAK